LQKVFILSCGYIRISKETNSPTRAAFWKKHRELNNRNLSNNHVDWRIHGEQMAAK
jgi:hypothetical protein